tara:strand:+ start:118 stop:1812 length:1695 start_codon:yes stop_codon:yes gene_type:complete
MWNGNSSMQFLNRVQKVFYCKGFNISILFTLLGFSLVASLAQESTEKNTSSDGNQTFVAREWYFPGTSIFSQSQLAEQVESFTNQELTFNQLVEVTSRIEQFYKDQGALGRATIPPQDVTSGRIQVDIVEARLGDVRYDTSGSTSVNEEIVTAIVKDKVIVGDFYNAKFLDRRILIADDLPGVSLSGFLQASNKPGHVDLVFKSSKEPPYIADLSVDNANSRSLGSKRITFNGMLVSPFRRGETIALQTLRSEGSRYARLSYGFPLGSGGWRMNLNGSRMNYRVVSKDLASLKIAGKVNEQGFSLRYPIIRTREGNLYTTIQFDDRSYETTVANAVQKDYSIKNTKVEFSSSFFDSFVGGGANSGSFSFTHGNVSGFNVSDASHTIINYALSRQQALTEKLSLYTSFQGQYGLDIPTGNPQQINIPIANPQQIAESEQSYLDSAENFSLGGLGGIRAYPSGEASGPQGQKLNVELRYLANKNLILKPFYDWGMVEKRDPSSLGPSGYEISGAGLNASWTAPLGFSVQATYARRIGQNPNPQPTGMDQDGSLKENRVWIVLARSF